MAGGTDLLTALQNGVTAINNLSNFLLNATSNSSSLRIAIPSRTTTRLTSTAVGLIYSPPAGVHYIVVQFVGGGGGGGGAQSGATGAIIAGSSGGTTTFNSVSANGGSGANGVTTVNSISYGVGGTGGAGVATRRQQGYHGGAGIITGNNIATATVGGNSLLGPGGAIFPSSGNAGNGLNAGANTGGGGSGGLGGSATFVNAGGGGGGEYVYLIVSNPSSSIAYSVGAGGLGGTSSNFNGGNGGSGLIFVEEFYA